MPRSEDFLEKPLPSSEGSEKIILGAILLDNNLIAQAVEELTPDHFYSPFNRRVFAAMITLFNESRPIDPITIGDVLQREGSLESLGGISTITNLTFGLPRFNNIDEYTRLVKEKSLARSVIRLSNVFAGLAHSEELVGQELVERCESQLFELNNSTSHTGFSSHQSLLTESIQRARLISETGQRIIGLPTHFTDYDDLTLGCHPSELIILAARPSMGKTALALNIAQNVAFRGRGVVAFFSLEMSSQQLIERIICSEANLNSHSYRTGRLSDDQWARVAEVEAQTREGRLFIDDTPAVNTSYLRAKLRRLVHDQRQLDLVIVDYLQLMSSIHNQSREREVSTISRELKALSKEFDVPVIATAQLNRGPEDRASHIPTIRDLRESGGIEQDADVVAFIYREDYYIKEPAAHTHIADLFIAKQRNGPIGQIRLQFNAPNSTFRNLAQQDF